MLSMPAAGCTTRCWPISRSPTRFGDLHRLGSARSAEIRFRLARFGFGSEIGDRQERDWKNAGFIDTLSVAYAEVGDFEQAIRWQKKALEDPAYQDEDGEIAREKLALFAKKQPFRE